VKSMRAAYDSDFAQWTSEQAELLRTGQFDQLDVDHIIEELVGVSGRDRREMINRLETMFEHMLKRDMFPSDDALRGWNVTVSRNASKIVRILESSPSLLQVLSAEATWWKAFHSARRHVMEEYVSKIPSDDPKLYFAKAMFEIEKAQ